MKQKTRRKFPAELVKEYGEQTYRDKRSTKCRTYDDAAWSSVYVAQACGEITEKEMNLFRGAIAKYARSTRFPKNFI